MSLILWNNSLSVNIKQVDSQHQKLVDMINQLHDAMKKGQANTTITKILNDMVTYTLVHFKTEEELFDKYNYSSKKVHKVEHDSFISKVEEFINDFNSGRKTLSIELMNFLTNWLSNHIKIQDKAYTSFLNSKGVV